MYRPATLFGDEGGMCNGECGCWKAGAFQHGRGNFSLPGVVGAVFKGEQHGTGQTCTCFFHHDRCQQLHSTSDLVGPPETLRAAPEHAHGDHEVTCRGQESSDGRALPLSPLVAGTGGDCWVFCS